MSETHAGGSTAPASDAPLSVEDAVSAYVSRVEREMEEPADNSTEGADDAATDTQSASQEADTTPPEQEVTGETQEADPAEVPPLELPRSWAKDKAEIWNGLDRAAQEYLLEHDSKSSAEVRRGQNEVAEQRKAIEAERGKAEQARNEYETKLSSFMQTIHSQGPFADIKTFDDVKNLQKSDPFRFQEYQLYSAEMQVYQNELTQAQTRKQAEAQTRFMEFVNKENTSLAEKMPEFADKAKAPELSKKMVDYLRDSIGITDQELGSFASGEKISPLDHRLQILAMKAMRYDEAQKAKPLAIPKVVPKVQKPGAAQPKGAAQGANIQALSNRLNQSGSIQDALALYQAKRAAGAS